MQQEKGKIGNHHFHVSYLLSIGIPYIELHRSTVGDKGQRVNIDTKGGNINWLGVSCNVLDELLLASTSITHQDKLELWNLL